MKISLFRKNDMRVHSKQIKFMASQI